MKNSKKSWLILAAAVLVIAIIVIVSVSSKGNQAPAEPTASADAAPTVETTVAPEQMVESTVAPKQTEVPELVHVETRNYELAFDGQLAEMVFYREIPDTAEDDLEFYTKINEQEHAVFTLVFNSAEGDIVHMITDAEGNRIPVAFMMNTLPEGIDEEVADNFYIAQSVVNEVVASIKVN